MRNILLVLLLSGCTVHYKSGNIYNENGVMGSNEKGAPLRSITRFQHWPQFSPDAVVGDIYDAPEVEPVDITKDSLGFDVYKQGGKIIKRCTKDLNDQYVCQ